MKKEINTIRTPKRGGGYRRTELSEEDRKNILEAIESFDWDNIVFDYVTSTPIIEIRTDYINGDVEIQTNMNLDIWIDKHLKAENQPNNKTDRWSIEMLLKHRTNKILWALYWAEVKRSGYSIEYAPDIDEAPIERDPNDDTDALREFISIVKELKPNEPS